MKVRRDGVDIKQAILRAAKKEFAERGYSGGRMSRIARDAGVNKALIHYYFSDKNSLYLEVLRSIYRGRVEHPESPDCFGGWRLTPSQKLHAIIYFMVNMFLKAADPEAMRIIFWELAEGGTNLEALMLEYIIPRQKILHNVLAEGIENGEFNPAHPRLSVMSIFSFISFYLINREIYRGTSVFRELYGEVSEQEVLSFVLDTVFRTLSPPVSRIQVPALPDELVRMLDNILALLIEKKDEIINDELLRRIEQIMR